MILLRRSLIFLVFSLACCQRDQQQLGVLKIVEPEYPAEAVIGNIQGTVRVSVIIGADGRVKEAKGSGAHPILVDSAERNVRHWIFGPFPRVAEFPIYHTVVFVFKLEGPPAFVVYPPGVRTFLPDRVELRSRLFKSDQPIRPSAPESSREVK